MNMIQDLQWTNVLSCNDCQEAFTNFYTKFIVIIKVFHLRIGVLIIIQGNLG